MKYLQEEEITPSEMMMEKLSILCNLKFTDSYFFERSYSQVVKDFEKVIWTLKEPTNEPRKIKYEGVEYHYKGVKDLTLGEYIDLDYYFVNDYVENFENICSVLYRKVRIDEWKNEIVEPYTAYDKQSRNVIFNGVCIEDVYNVLNNFLDFRNRITKNYAPLFSDPNEVEKEDEEQKEEPTSIEIAKQQEIEKRLKKWSWEKLIYDVSGHDITKYESVLETNVVLIFNTLSMKHELSI